MTMNCEDRLNSAQSRPQQEDTDSLHARKVAQSIIRSVGGLVRFKERVPLLIQAAIDAVVDEPRTGRRALDETDINERIYLRVKIKVQLRSLFRVQKGTGAKVDQTVDGTEISIQSTVGPNWSIPPEAVGHPCILVKSDEKDAVYSVGVLVVRSSMLNNRAKLSGRRTISSFGLSRIHWVLEDGPLPKLPNHSTPEELDA